MKKIFIFAAIIAVLVNLTGCQKDDDSFAPAKQDAPLVFTATIEEGTRTNVDVASGAVSWEMTDAIIIQDAANNSAVYTITAINGGRATLEYKKGAHLGAGPYTATYGKAPAKVQTYSAKVKNLPMTATSKTTNLTFTVTCGLLEVSLFKTDESIKSIAVTDFLNETYTLICDPAQSISSYGKDFFIALPEGTYRKFVLTNANDDVCTLKSSKGINIYENQIQPISFSAKLNFIDPYNGHKYVDLGLPSGIKWATMNVGASKPEEYGDYYTWGDTEPYYTEGHAYDNPCSNWNVGKTGYNWASYKWCNGAQTKLTRYCKDREYGNEGFRDGVTFLYQEDDVAHVKWGANWIIPNTIHLYELFEKCTRESVTVRGIKGCKFTGPNGNSIFLPAAGYREGSVLKEAGTDGYYWSNTLSVWNSYAYYSQIIKYWEVSKEERCLGLSIRPVSP